MKRTEVDGELTVEKTGSGVVLRGPVNDIKLTRVNASILGRALLRASTGENK